MRGFKTKTIRREVAADVSYEMGFRGYHLFGLCVVEGEPWMIRVAFSKHYSWGSAGKELAESNAQVAEAVLGFT